MWSMCRRSSDGPRASPQSGQVDALALVVVEDHDRVVRRAARGPPRLGADVEEEARDPGAHGAKARVEELDVSPEEDR
jgi:hypothetical protein